MLGLLVLGATLVLDQFSKWWVLAVLGINEHESFAVTPFMNFVLARNTGISYGLMQLDSTAGQLTLAALAAVVSGALWIWLAREPYSRLLAAGLGFIIGGALGNAIDRLHLGGVADFVQLHAFGKSWYIFNVADAAIVAGVAGLLYEFLITSRKDAASRGQNRDI